VQNLTVKILPFSTLSRDNESISSVSPSLPLKSNPLLLKLTLFNLKHVGWDWVRCDKLSIPKSKWI